LERGVEIIRDKAAMQRHAATRGGARVGFVPTMGALHAGHLTLLDHARPGCDLVAASVFVNPTQFGPGEDFERYPRDLDADAHQLEHAGCDLLFAPSTADMYAADASTRVEVADLQDVLCGASRPGHFRGVATVVAKLFNLVQPQVAVFGQKDAQQAVLLQRMVRDLDFPIAIRVAPIVRDADGVALSSRNAYLSADERRDARLLRAALDAAVAALAGGARSAAALTAAMRAVLAGGTAVRVDYVAVVDATSLRPLDTLSGRVLVAVAAFVGRTRLIDNVVLDVRGDAVREVGLGV
jgi:pantoate--beta-alanine ligase